MEKEKRYCDRCKRLDYDCAVLVELHRGVFRYTNLRATLESKFTEIESSLNRKYASLQFLPVDLCPECFIEFFSFAKGSPKEELKEDSVATNLKEE